MSANGRLLPAELAPIAGGQLRPDAAAAFNAMNVEARAKGLELLPKGPASSYRTYTQQVTFWRLFKAGEGAPAAEPGTSNHGWGLAVDFATPEMRALVDRIGHKYGWAKEWSDAPTEWWHVIYRPGVWSGTDPGPQGQGTPGRPPAVPEPPEDTMALAVGTMKDGRFEVFVETASGEVFHTWQAKDGGGWAGAEKGKQSAVWYSLGTPGK